MLPIGRMNHRTRHFRPQRPYKERTMLPPGTKTAFITGHRPLYRRVRCCASRLIEIEQHVDHALREDFYRVNVKYVHVEK